MPLWFHEPQWADPTATPVQSAQQRRVRATESAKERSRAWVRRKPAQAVGHVHSQTTQEMKRFRRAKGHSGSFSARRAEKPKRKSSARSWRAGGREDSRLAARLKPTRTRQSHYEHPPSLRADPRGLRSCCRTENSGYPCPG